LSLRLSTAATTALFGLWRPLSLHLIGPWSMASLCRWCAPTLALQCTLARLATSALLTLLPLTTRASRGLGLGATTSGLCALRLRGLGQGDVDDLAPEAAVVGLARVLDILEYAIDVGLPRLLFDDPCELYLRVEFTALVELPDLFSVTGLFQLAGKSTEVGPHIVDVPEQHAARALVARRVHGLREVDNHRPVWPDQDVVLRQIAMDEPSAEHTDDLVEHERMVSPRTI